MGDDEFYPDVVRAGGLGAALRTESALLEPTALLGGAPDPHHRVELRDGDRDVIVGRSPLERSFMVRLRANHKTLAWSTSADLPVIAGAVQDWLAGMEKPLLTEKWPFLTRSQWSGRTDRVERAWQLYRADGMEPRRRLGWFVIAAMDEPRLRVLHPFTSHYTLGFRRTVDYRSKLDLWVDPLGEGRYRVSVPRDREHGIADAAGSVRLVLDLLDEIEAGQEGLRGPS